MLSWEGRLKFFHSTGRIKQDQVYFKSVSISRRVMRFQTDEVLSRLVRPLGLLWCFVFSTSDCGPFWDKIAKLCAWLSLVLQWPAYIHIKLLDLNSCNVIEIFTLINELGGHCEAVLSLPPHCCWCSLLLSHFMCCKVPDRFTESSSTCSCTFPELLWCLCLLKVFDLIFLSSC